MRVKYTQKHANLIYILQTQHARAVEKEREWFGVLGILVS